MSHEADFWAERDEYHDLVETYESNIEMYHPHRITSRGQCSCLEYVTWCGYAVTSVEYYRHNGPHF